MPETYADQWQAAAAVLREKADEFDKIAKQAPLRPKPTERIMRAVVNARSFVDLAKGGNYPDEFVHDMAKVMAELVELLDA